MPLDLPPVGPPPLNIAADESPGAGGGGPAVLDVAAQATEDKPSPVDVTASVVTPPLMAAGVKLAILVLSIAGASIAALVAYLFMMDLITGWNVQDAYGQLLGRHKLGSEVETLVRLKALEGDIGRLRDTPDAGLDAARLAEDRATIELLQRLPSLPADQKVALPKCLDLPPPANTLDRTQQLNRCAEIVRSVTDDAIRASGSVTDLQAASDAIGKLIDGRQSLHAFWLQAAQLVLLNLLLPILTALLGYIFGTQQGAARASR